MKKPTRVLALATPDEIVEHVTNQCVLERPKVRKNSCITVHQCPGFTPEKKLNKRKKTAG